MVIQEKPRRILLALVVAIALAFVLVLAKDASAQAMNPCRGLTPSDPTWWLMGCYLMP